MIRGSMKFRARAVTVAAIAVCLTGATAASASAQGTSLVGARDASLFVESNAGVKPVVDFIDSARKTLDYGIYQISDEDIIAALKRAKARGVRVRVMVTWQTFPANSGRTRGDSTPKSIEYCGFNRNVPVLNDLAAAGIKTAFSPFTYTYYHEKAAIADGHYSFGRALIMDFNSVASYMGPSGYADEGGTRGFGVITSNRADVKEIQQVYDADFPPVGTPRPFTRPSLIWSPNGPGFKPRSQGYARIERLIETADKTLDVYVLLLDYEPVRAKLIEAAKRGVTVRIIFNNYGPRALTYSQIKQLTAAGVQLAYNPRNSIGKIFVHTKTILRDAATSNRMAYVGSMNVGDFVSVNSERELGILLSRKSITDTIAATYATDWGTASKLEFLDGVPTDPYPAPTSTPNYCG